MPGQNPQSARNSTAPSCLVTPQNKGPPQTFQFIPEPFKPTKKPNATPQPDKITVVDKILYEDPIPDKSAVNNKPALVPDKSAVNNKPALVPDKSQAVAQSLFDCHKAMLDHEKQLLQNTCKMCHKYIDLQGQDLFVLDSCNCTTHRSCLLKLCVEALTSNQSEVKCF